MTRLTVFAHLHEIAIRSRAPEVIKYRSAASTSMKAGAEGIQIVPEDAKIVNNSRATWTDFERAAESERVALMKHALSASTLHLYADPTIEELRRAVAVARNNTNSSHGYGCVGMVTMSGNGYAQWLKNQGCRDDIEFAEQQLGVRYDFIVRFRPDVEYVGALPPADEWLMLRRDLVLTPIAQRWTIKSRPLPSQRWRLQDHVVSCGPDHDGELFVDDNGILFPRDHRFAASYFAIAERYNSCTRNHIEERSHVCGSLAQGPECAVMHALRYGSGVDGVYVGELPWMRHHAWLECMPPGLPLIRGAKCPRPCNGCPTGHVLARRRRYISSVSEAPPWPMLSQELVSTHFANGTHLHTSTRRAIG